MKQNIDKTEIVIMGKKDQAEAIIYEVSKLEVKTYKYLGFRCGKNNPWGAKSFIQLAKQM